MVVDNDCKNQIIRAIKAKLNGMGPIIGPITKPIEKNRLNEFINSIPNTEHSLTLCDYLVRHPEVQSNYPQTVRLLPQCTYKYNMRELIECLHEIKGYI